MRERDLVVEDGSCKETSDEVDVIGETKNFHVGGDREDESGRDHTGCIVCRRDQGLSETEQQTELYGINIKVFQTVDCIGK